MAERPLIGVTGPAKRWSMAWWATRLSLWLVGARAYRLTAENYQQRHDKPIQGVIIGGGDDIDPGLYGADSSGRAAIDPERDRFEIEMIEEALATHLPILGICRGAQLINVVLGGNLHGDIRKLRRKTSNRRTPLPRKTALASGEGRLPGILQRQSWRINSLHHQAIDRLGQGLVITARDLDGFVQAVEAGDHRLILGVQWHPEYLFYLGHQRRLFHYLVDEARKAAPEPLHD